MASIRKRLLPAKKDGSRALAYEVSYRDQGGKRRRKQFGRRKDAAAFRDRAGVEVLDGTHVPDRETVTVKEAAKIWLAACAAGRQGRHPVEPLTLQQYETHVRLHIIPRLGETRLNRLSGPMVAEYRDWLLENRSRALAKVIMVSLRAILSEAQARGLASGNPATGIAVHTSQRRQEHGAIPTRSEVRDILSYASAARNSPQKHIARAWHRGYALLMTAALTGLRSSELRGLAWKTGADLDGRILHVVQRADENGVIGPPKSASGWREIDLPETLVATLREWKLACPPGKLGLVFPNWQGNVEGHPNIQRRIWHPAQERAKTKRRYRFHDLRHFRASCLIADGANPKEVMVEMGHASIQMTFDTYGHLFPEDAAPRRARAENIAAGVLAPRPYRRKLGANRCLA